MTSKSETVKITARSKETSFIVWRSDGNVIITATERERVVSICVPVDSYTQAADHFNVFKKEVADRDRELAATLTIPEIWEE